MKSAHYFFSNNAVNDRQTDSTDHNGNFLGGDKNATDSFRPLSMSTYTRAFCRWLKMPEFRSLSLFVLDL